MRLESAHVGCMLSARAMDQIGSPFRLRSGSV